MLNQYKNLEAQFNKLFRHLKIGSYLNQGFSDYAARKKVSELLGHHRDDVTRIYLAE